MLRDAIFGIPLRGNSANDDQRSSQVHTNRISAVDEGGIDLADQGLLGTRPGKYGEDSKLIVSPPAGSSLP